MFEYNEHVSKIIFGILAIFVARSWRACRLAVPLKYDLDNTEGLKSYHIINLNDT